MSFSIYALTSCFLIRCSSNHVRILRETNARRYGYTDRLPRRRRSVRARVVLKNQTRYLPPVVLSHGVRTKSTACRTRPVNRRVVDGFGLPDFPNHSRPGVRTHTHARTYLRFGRRVFILRFFPPPPGWIEYGTPGRRLDPGPRQRGYPRYEKQHTNRRPGRCVAGNRFFVFLLCFLHDSPTSP